MKANYTTPPCCAKHRIVVMDYKWPMFEEKQESMVNRVCLWCNTHWAGPVDNVRQFTGKEWDRHIEEAV